MTTPADKPVDPLVESLSKLADPTRGGEGTAGVLLDALRAGEGTSPDDNDGADAA